MHSVDLQFPQASTPLASTGLEIRTRKVRYSMNPMYLLAGVYFEERNVLVLKPRARHPDFANRPVEVFFSGKVEHYKQDPNEAFVGYVLEQNERVRVFDFELLDDRLHFQKCYNTDYFVFYYLDLQTDGTWSGTYVGRNNGELVEGIARCTVSQLDRSQLEADKEKFIRLKKAAARRERRRRRKEAEAG